MRRRIPFALALAKLAALFDDQARQLDMLAKEHQALAK